MTRTQIARQAIDAHNKAFQNSITAWNKGLHGQARQLQKLARRNFERAMEMKNRMIEAGDDVSFLP